MPGARGLSQSWWRARGRQVAWHTITSAHPRKPISTRPAPAASIPRPGDPGRQASAMRNMRRMVQAGFLAATLIGVFAVRGNAERWCPFGGVEALPAYWAAGNMVCSLGVSNFFALAALLASVLVLRRAFCGYLCPIGTISEWTGHLAARLGVRPLRVPRSWDRVLSLAPYAVLGTILCLTWRAGELVFRGCDPCYALLSRHGEDITFWAYVVSGGLVVGAVFVRVPFCRWACPLAAVMNPLSRFGLARVQRDGDVCSACGKCSAACPMSIPVDQHQEVRVARCTSCLECVRACPVSSSGGLTWGPSGRRWPQVALVALLVVAIASAVGAAWALPLPSFVKEKESDQAPAATKTLELRIKGVRCRGTAQLLTYFLFRDDIAEVPGYLRVEAWPQEGYARVRITYDPERTGPEWIQEAIVLPYFDQFQGFERFSPFEIAGYAPWGEDPGNAG